MIPSRVVAVGARTPVGLTAESSMAAARAGISRLREHPFLLDAGGDPLICARDARLAPAAPRIERLVALAAHAIDEVLEKTFRAPGPEGLRVLLALGEERRGFAVRDAGRTAEGVARALASRPSLEVEPVIAGHAAALGVIETVAAAIGRGELQLAVVCGADSYLDADALDELEAAGRIARAAARGGFHPGEAAGALLLASDTACSRFGLRALATVLGAASGREQRSLADDEGILGEELASVLLRAGAPLAPRGTRADDVYCDVNGERHRSDEWGFALLRAPRLFVDGTQYRSNVGAWGDVGAATGALSCIAATQAWSRGYASGPIAMAWGASDGGLRGAVLLQEGTG